MKNLFKIVLVLILALPLEAFAAIGFDNAGANSGTFASGSSQYTYAAATIGGTNRMLCVNIFVYDHVESLGDIASVTAVQGASDVAMKFMGQKLYADPADTREIDLYCMINPDTGTGSIKINLTLPLAITGDLRSTEESFTGVYQGDSTITNSSHFATTTAKGTGTTAISSTLTAPEANSWYSISEDNDADAVTDGTNWTTRVTKGTVQIMADSNGGLTGSNSQTATLGSTGDWAVVQFAFGPAPAGVATPLPAGVHVSFF